MSRNPDTRLRVLNFIRQFFDERGYAPTVRDIVRGCNISTPSVVQHHLNMLEKTGLIARDPSVFRSIQLKERKSVSTSAVPLLGTIAAGQPIDVPAPDAWASMPESVLHLPGEVTGGKKDVFALRVKGTSMIDAYIDDGDIVLLQAARSVDDGAMAAVWLKTEHEVTLKKVFHEAGQVKLQPANATMKPMFFKPDDVEIQGKVIGVVRTF